MARSSELELEKSVDQEVVQASLEQIDYQPEETSEEDEKLEKNDFHEMQTLYESYMSNNTDCLVLTSMNPHKLDEFVKECTPVNSTTSFCHRVKCGIVSAVPVSTFTTLILKLLK